MQIILLTPKNIVLLQIGHYHVEVEQVHKLKLPRTGRIIAIACCVIALGLFCWQVFK